MIKTDNSVPVHQTSGSVVFRNKLSAPAADNVSPGRVLLVCLTNWSFGEATLALRLVQNAEFEDVHFVISPLLAPLFRHYGVAFTKLSPGSSAGLNKLLFLSAIQQFAPDEIVLADPLTFLESRLYYGLTPEYLASLGIPISGIDIYAFSQSDGQAPPPEGGIFSDYTSLMETLERIFIPCPLFDPRLLPPVGSSGAVACYSALPQLEVRENEIQRDDPDDELRVVVTCAAWEDKLPLPRPKRCIQHCVRHYMFSMLTDMAKNRRLHVDLIGMSDLKAYIRPGTISYEYHSNVSPTRLQELLAAANIYFTSNVIAASISDSLSLGTPVVCVQNSKAITFPLSEISADKSKSYPDEVTLPPFLISPIGWYDFLQPLLAKSRYSHMLHHLEIATPINVASKLVLDWIANNEDDLYNSAYLQDIRALPKVIMGAL